MSDEDCYDPALAREEAADEAWYSAQEAQDRLCDAGMYESEGDE